MHSIINANLLKVTIQPSSKKYKKIDVFKNNIYLCSIGDTRYGDYATYVSTHGFQYANARRILYKKRHENNRHILNTPSYYADQILW